MKQPNKNFLIGVLCESFWGMGFGLFMPATLVNLALVDLGGSATLAGLLASLFSAGLTLPQAFSALALGPRFTDPPRVVLIHFPALLGPLIAGMGFLLVPAGRPDIRLALLLSGFTLFSLGIGWVVPHWVGMIGRCLPEKIRGRYFGTSFFASGLCASATGWMGSRWAAHHGLEWGYALCFLLAVPFMTVSVLIMLFFKPLTGRPAPTPPGVFWKGFQLMGKKLAEPGSFRVGLALVFLLVAATPGNLYTVFLREKAGVEASWFELFTPALTLGGMVGAFLLGWLSDHKGFRLAYLVAFGAGLASLGFIFFWGNPLTPALAFAFFGFNNAAFPVINLVMILKLAGKKESTVQTGLFNTLMGPWNFIAPLFLGWLAGRAGYPWAFGWGALCCLAAFGILALNRNLDRRRRISR